MLKQRFFTILVLVPLLLGIVYFAPDLLFKQLILIFVLIGGYEWAQMVPIHRNISQILFLLAILGVIWITNMFFDVFLLIGIASVALSMFIVLFYPKSQKYFGNPLTVAIQALILLPLFYHCTINIFTNLNGKDLLLYFLLLISATDIGAYVIGKAFGKHKLIVEVSPGKTIEGSIGGFVFAMIIATLGYFYFNPLNIVGWFLGAILISIVSVFGDLFISVLKRRAKIKDTGNIFPGHGGMLDRIDSLIASMPIFYGVLTFIPLGV